MDHLDKVVENIHEHGDPELKIEWEKVDDIPVEVSGKRRLIISKLQR